MLAAFQASPLFPKQSSRRSVSHHERDAAGGLQHVEDAIPDVDEPRGGLRRADQLQLRRIDGARPDVPAVDGRDEVVTGRIGGQRRDVLQRRIRGTRIDPGRPPSIEVQMPAAGPPTAKRTLPFAVETTFDHDQGATTVLMVAALLVQVAPPSEDTQRPYDPDEARRLFPEALDAMSDSSLLESPATREVRFHVWPLSTETHTPVSVATATRRSPVESEAIEVQFSPEAEVPSV